jgi:transcriptional regulator with XRE-family HTH domain
MLNLNTVLNERIARVARKEIKAQTGTTKKATVRYRSDIAGLKREVARLRKITTFLEAQEKKRVAQQPAPQEAEGVRFRADGLRSHRAKLGLSAKDYGMLVGVAGLTIYQWEGGKSRPRQAQLAKLAAVRGIGKREALKRLEMLGGNSQGTVRQRGTYKQTAQEMILSLVKSRKATTGTAINAAWAKAGRPGKCDYVLSNMVSAGKLKRSKLKDERGSRYSA